MIISASRREDMPAHRGEYLAKMLRTGQCLVRNPFNAKQERIVSLLPEDVDGIVLWSKYPAGILEEPLKTLLAPYAYYLQFTLNGYGQDMEPGVPLLRDRIDLYRRLVDQLGPMRVRWRYDPILLSNVYDVDFHSATFGRIAQDLAGYTSDCTISFLDVYQRIRSAMKELSMRPPSDLECHTIATRLSQIASQHHITIKTCAEEGDYIDLAITPARCIDADLLMQISQKPFLSRKDPNQRPLCGCSQSVDIGVYGACDHACRYCYARRPSATNS